MRRLMTWLFGWQWIHCNYPRAIEIIRLVRYRPDGRAYVVWSGPHLIWLDSPDPWEITPLWWRPSSDEPAPPVVTMRVTSIAIDC